MTTLCGGIEAGGTKFICMIAGGPGDVRAEARIPTTTPAETVARAVAFFRQRARALPIAALGVASFGPLDLDPGSATYGYITTTPKPGWSHTDLVGMLRATFDVPVVFETDVNSAAYGEYRWGAAPVADPIVYLTIGTGIGAGVVCHGRPVHGLVHPEVGHMLIPRDRTLDAFPGACPYHGDCFEGLASGPALARRWGQPAETLPDDHPAWGLEAHYLALALTNLVLGYSPRRIVLGGGVMERERLFPLVRLKVQRLLNGYLQSRQIVEAVDQYIVPPALGTRSGVLGAIALALDSLNG